MRREAGVSLEREGTMEERASTAVWSFAGESAAVAEGLAAVGGVVASSPDIVCGVVEKGLRGFVFSDELLCVRERKKNVTEGAKIGSYVSLQNKCSSK